MEQSSVSLSHCGIYVFDLERMERFYCDTLGFQVTDRAPKLVFLSRSPRDHHQLALFAGRTSPRDTLSINQISFRAPSLADIKAIKKAIEKEPDVSDVRPTDHGTAWALYFRDPEGNRIEFFVDTPWYVAQPRAKIFNLDRPDEEIYAETEAECRALPGFKMIEEWRADFTGRLASAGGSARS